MRIFYFLWTVSLKFVNLFPSNTWIFFPNLWIFPSKMWKQIQILKTRDFFWKCENFVWTRGLFLNSVNFFVELVNFFSNLRTCFELHYWVREHFLNPWKKIEHVIFFFEYMKSFFEFLHFKKNHILVLVGLNAGNHAPPNFGTGSIILDGGKWWIYPLKRIKKYITSTDPHNFGTGQQVLVFQVPPILPPSNWVGWTAPKLPTTIKLINSTPSVQK